MSLKKKGRRSFLTESAPVITAWASIAGKKESEGPLGKTFDRIYQDTTLGKKTWEEAETSLQAMALEALLDKSGLEARNIDVVFSGDLLNQCIGSSFCLRGTGMPSLGLYGACSTMAQSMLLGTMAVDGGFAKRAVAMTSSHFAAAERQYRFPLNYGGQRPPTAQWTVTGSGAVLLGGDWGPRIEAATIGSPLDLGITDANDMGAAMAPAAADTIFTHLTDLDRQPEDYDLIVTGDLGVHGKELALELLRRKGILAHERLDDCGCMVFDCDRQDVHSGGSGCGCSAVVLCGYLLNQVKSGVLKRILFCGTGALMSPVSAQQSRPIPGICHAVSIIAPEVKPWTI